MNMNNTSDDFRLMNDKLKDIQNLIQVMKVELAGISSKLEISYQYEEELRSRMNQATHKTKDLQVQFFQKSSEITELYGKMKEIFDEFYIKGLYQK